MKILVIGSGAREHAIVSALLRDGTDHQIIAAPGNAGIAQLIEVVSLNIEDGPLIADYAAEQGIELVIIGPEAPLVAGVADALRAVGVPVFGPDKAAAQLEGSKDFAKDVMNAARVPNGRSISATTLREVETALDEFGSPYVVKADGLAAGKGVIVTNDRKAAQDHAEFFIQHGPVLIEEFLDGQEVSLFVLSDGDAVVPLSPAQDYKRAFDNDEGPNTGGMGAYSPLPWLPEGFVDEIIETVAQPTISEMSRRGTPFVGLLYCGLILTSDGVRVIEFNARFGDPERRWFWSDSTRHSLTCCSPPRPVALPSFPNPCSVRMLHSRSFSRARGTPSRPKRANQFWDYPKPSKCPVSRSLTRQPPVTEKVLYRLVGEFCPSSPEAATLAMLAVARTWPSTASSWTVPITDRISPNGSPSDYSGMASRLFRKGSRPVYSRNGIYPRVVTVDAVGCERPRVRIRPRS